MYDNISQLIMWGAMGSVACALTSYFVVGWRKPRPTLKHRLEYSFASGMACFALLWALHRFFPEQVVPYDFLAIGAFSGMTGVSRVLSLLVKKLGIDSEIQFLDNKDKDS